MASKQALGEISNTHHCFSSANRHSHYNRQMELFQKNITQLEPKHPIALSSHIQDVADMFTLLTQHPTHSSQSTHTPHNESQNSKRRSSKNHL